VTYSMHGLSIDRSSRRSLAVYSLARWGVPNLGQQDACLLPNEYLHKCGWTCAPSTHSPIKFSVALNLTSN
jgi:hypothetical protein